VDPGSVTAEVQGTRAAPYQIEIRVKTLSAAGWGRITDALSAQPIFAAKLLTGEMPEDIEAVFQEQKLSLFPEKLKDLTTKCSCPDWSNPCKHIAAVYYLLGEEFDRDPFLIFKLRGMERDELLKRLGRFAGGATAKTGKKTAGAVEKHEDTPAAIPEPLPDDPELFWLPKNRDQWEAKEVSIPTLAAPLVKRLGAFPFWRGETPFLESLEAIYVGASPGGLDVYLGERKTGSK
jgi:uncharacterized Zn finger protein